MNEAILAQFFLAKEQIDLLKDRTSNDGHGDGGGGGDGDGDDEDETAEQE